MFQPGDIFPRTGQPVLDVLCSKHPEVRPLTAIILEAYGGKPPALVMVDITNEMVAIVVRQLLGALGPRGDDSVSLQHWLRRFGATSTGLRKIFSEFGDRMANGRPPWAAYRELMLGRLIGFDKCLGVRPVRVGETLRQILEKCVLAMAGEEAKETCRTDQL